jgi:hypothetical protein
MREVRCRDSAPPDLEALPNRPPSRAGDESDRPRPGTERVVEAAEVPRELEQCAACRVEAGRVVRGRLERPCRPGLDRELVLEPVDRRHIVLVRRIDEDPCRYGYPRRPDSFDGYEVFAGLVKDPADEVVLVDHHHRDVAVPAVREGDRRPLGDIDDRRAVQGVPVHPDHRLVIDRRRSPVVLEPIDSSGTGVERREHAIALGPDEVLDGHRHGHGVSLQRLGSGTAGAWGFGRADTHADSIRGWPSGHHPKRVIRLVRKRAVPRAPAWRGRTPRACVSPKSPADPGQAAPAGQTTARASSSSLAWWWLSWSAPDW